MNKMLSILMWVGVGAVGAAAFGVLALSRGETISAGWLVIAGVCSYLVAYRFYSRYLAFTVFGLDDRRATPAERLNNGRDFCPTTKWVAAGQHFSAISGAGPLVGPTLAAQFGFLPGTLWLIAGVVLGGAVQDMVVLCASVRRDGKSLGQMAKDEVNPVAGMAAMVAVFAIMIILLAVLALVVVNALRDSPWGLFTIVATIPIALLMGVWMNNVRPGQVTEATVIGVVLLIASLFGGQWVAQHPTWGPAFTWSGPQLAWGVIVYGFIASVLPIWLLLTPRGYLSSVLKIGTILVLGAAIVVLMPPLQLPAVTQFIDGSGPVFAGKLFPFAFITIACGAMSGFHALISSGTTPKIVRRESDVRLIGYGSMLAESLVGLMALIAAASLDPGVYFAMNVGPAILGTTPESAAAAIAQWGFMLRPEQMTELAKQMGEATLLSRTGGAPSLAVGMAGILGGVFSGAGLGLWYHFAILFEAVFILTTVDAGTRVGRFMLQEMLGHVYAPLGRVSWYPSIIVSSALVVLLWGYFLYQGVVDPLGGINTLWPLFGIANQLLAAVALCVVSTILVKMGKIRYVWVTVLPLVWLAAATLTAGYQKVFSPLPGLGFLAHARSLSTSTDPNAARMIFNDRVDAVLCLGFMVVVLVVIAASVRECWMVAAKRKAPVVNESPYVESQLDTVTV
ncbi:MAG: carbon starvation protein A [Acidobacteria bacterium RIFCSPLOWO2_02_FULL_68_18]|nr:MAG: carbon starvation protein A [Acidobacteria bacterium RIFCSPLOWO2_02_FULL_68_18]OFW51854.1 MAG: carbon starvation protein A [Acidobacteria bacterium RIFCSPLOWO2_12_FULL_68_19]